MGFIVIVRQLLPALLSHMDVAHIENAGAVFYLSPASLQSSMTALFPVSAVISLIYMVQQISYPQKLWITLWVTRF
jgi:hypothetical protein